MAGLRTGIRRRYQELSKALDERGRRLFAAAEARAYGHGGVSVVSRITGIARSTIVRGVREIQEKVQVMTSSGVDMVQVFLSNPFTAARDIADIGATVLAD